MALDQPIDDQLRSELADLHGDVSRARERGSDRDAVNRAIDTFQTAWFDKLETQQRLEINVSKNALVHAVEVFDHDKRFDAFLRATWSLKTMSPESQDEYKARMPKRSVNDERNTAKLMERLTRELSTAINERFGTLRLEMVNAIDDIRDGRAPALSQQTEYQFYATKRTSSHAYREEVMAQFYQANEKVKANGLER